MRLYDKTSMANPAAYGVSKAGLLQLVRYLATTLAPQIRVNAITPGGVWRDQPPIFRRSVREPNAAGKNGHGGRFQRSNSVPGQRLIELCHWPESRGGRWMDRMVTSIRIRDRMIGDGHPCFVIAEAGVNHNGDPELARKLVDAAAAAGADAVKFQTFRTEGIMVRSAPKASYQKETTGSGESQFDMVRRLELPFEEFRKLQEYSEQRGILFLSTPFDFDAVDYLASLDVAAFKISSGEVTNHPFLARVARTGKPVILSTGMSTLNEVEEAVRVLKSAGAVALSLLHCVSNYPAIPSDVNLRAMFTMRNAFSVPVGYSDHTLGIEIALAAVALGASIVEKHFTLDRSLPGPDHRASLQPDELSAMVRGIRNVEQALGHGRKEPAASEADTAAAARRSLVAACDIPAGTALTEEVIAIKRPGTGMPPAMRSSIVGRTAKRDIPAGTVLTLEMLV